VEVRLSAAERVTASYYFAGGQRIALRVSDSELTYLHGDHLGSASLATDDAGAQVSALRYYPYGETRSGAMPTNYQFTGQRRESGLGLYDYNARYYDPYLNRFIQADSIVPSPGNPQSLNRYAYCYNNPLKHIDVDGHFPWIVGGGLVGMAVAYGGQVVGNLNSGMELGAALTTNIDPAAIATGGLIGMAAGTGIMLLAPVATSLVGGGTLATGGGSLAAAGTLAATELMDGDDDEMRIAQQMAAPFRGYQFRAVNPNHLPNPGAQAKMLDPAYQEFINNYNYDCSEIARDLYNAAGSGRIAQIHGVTKWTEVVIPEAGNMVRQYYNHYVYTDGGYVFDPRLSRVPIPWGDYLRLLKGLNPEALME